MSGAPVDIVTGRPLSEGFGEKDGRGSAAEEMMNKMRMAGVSRSEAAQVVAQKILEVLEQKIANILRDDPQAKICLDILRAISQPEITAQEAARKYFRRFSPIIPALANETTPEKEVL